MGWAATTPGGRGGQIIRVTTLNPEGPGSLLEALHAKGPRIIVFEVGGVIDLGKRDVRITEPYLTIAGQTAPSPGITLIRGQSVAIVTHDVIVQHLRIRPGDANEPKAQGYSTDGIRTDEGAHDVIIDHCTVTWATNKNFAVSGPRFDGKTPDEWREHTSHRVTVSNSIIAEALSRSTHWKVEHSKGALIHDNTTDILMVNNLFAHNYERSPLFKGGVRGAIINNLIFDPGQRAVHYNLIANEWTTHPYQVGEMTAVGNVLRAGMSTPMPLAFLEIGGAGDLEYYGKDNIAVDKIDSQPLPMFGRYTTSPAKIIEEAEPPIWPADWSIQIPAVDVEQYDRAGQCRRAALGPRGPMIDETRRRLDRRRRRGTRLDRRQPAGPARLSPGKAERAAVQPRRLESLRHDPAKSPAVLRTPRTKNSTLMVPVSN